MIEAETPSSMMSPWALSKVLGLLCLKVMGESYQEALIYCLKCELSLRDEPDWEAKREAFYERKAREIADKVILEASCLTR